MTPSASALQLVAHAWSAARPLRLPRTRGDVHRGRPALTARRGEGGAAALQHGDASRSRRSRASEADGAVVPIENSVEGGVAATLDELSNGDPLMITREMHVEVQFALLAKPGTRPEDIKTGRDAPACRGAVPALDARRTCPTPRSCWSRRRRTRRRCVAVPDSPYDAAISAPIAAQTYRLATLATAIADRAGAVTRFVLVSRPGTPPARDRGRQDVAGRVHPRQPPGGAAGAARAVRRTRRRPDPDRVPADRLGARQVLLLARLRGARRRRPGRRGADGAAAYVRRRALPRLLPARRRCGHRDLRPARPTPTSPTPPPGSSGSAPDVGCRPAPADVA